MVTAFPAEQRSTITRLRELHLRARVSVPISYRDREANAARIIVLMRWEGGHRYVRKLYAHVNPDGTVWFTRRRS